MTSIHRPISTAQVFEALGRATGVGTPTSQHYGPHAVAIMLTAAWLADAGQCITVENVSRYAGQAPGPCGARMRRHPHLRPVQPTCNGTGCGLRRSHYALDLRELS